MAVGPVNVPAQSAPSWKITPPHDKQIQGLVVSGFADLPFGRALFLRFDWPATQTRRGAWLEELNSIAPITDADGSEPRAAALGFTWTGLERMGLPASSLASFDISFREGMFQEDRMRRLGDRRLGAWLGTVTAGGPQWSANTPPQQFPGVADEEAIVTSETVHALLLLYEATDDAAQKWDDEVTAALAKVGVHVVRRLPLLLSHEGPISREHFGFADGISQPAPFDDQAVTLGGKPAPKGGPNNVPLGEIVIGYTNAFGDPAPGPVAEDGAASACLPPHPKAAGFRDLGVNGSYMVVRQLSQDVAAFWNSMAAGAARLGDLGPQVTADWLAERVVGRDTNGNLLCPGGYLPPDASGQPDNEFLYLSHDPEGRGCPVGSHVRRANPRDGLAPKAAMGPTLLDASKNHRILRRGRKYGPKLQNRTQDDGAARGLLFICLNTDLARQFEFVQQTWLLNQNFATLFDETDPLVGPKGPMTLRDKPLRRIVPVDTFVQLIGGDYFFLPSMAAIDYFSQL